MNDERRIRFDPYALDLVNECLWKGPEAIRLRPKAFAVLEHLVGRPGQLVTKESLIEAVWGGTFVGDAVLKVTIRQLREALADDPRAPRFIETSHRRGYRFIGRIAADIDARPASAVEGGPVAVEAVWPASRSAEFVGRDAALARMHGWLARMRGGERQVVFVSGEAGIGKTTLIDAFVRSLAGDRAVRIGSGQCLEQYGTGEAYLPVLDALRQLCGQDPEVVGVLRTHAPMWLLQMPSLVTASDREAFGREGFGGTRERMLRELGEAFGALASRGPLVIVLEDLHWSDFSTLDLISYLARQRAAAELMIVGTFRPAELIASGHPLKAVKQELLSKQLCDELALEYLSEPTVAEYLAARFPANRFPPELAALIHERTEGNPLFMVNTVDYLVAEGVLAEHEGHWQLTAAIDAMKLGVPDSVRHLIDRQIEHLPPEEQQLLEAAAVAGAEFSTLSLASALDADVGEVEARCEALGRRNQFIRDAGARPLPRGEVVGSYAFVHAVYRHVLYERVPASRRTLLHRRLAERGEQVYGDHAVEIAAEFAMHFERAANPQRAAYYLRLAAGNAMRRSAYREAVALSRQGIALLQKLPDTNERVREELMLHLALGVPLVATEGYAATSVGNVYLKARHLCLRLGDTPEIAQVLWGLWTFGVLRADFAWALDNAEELLSISERLQYPGMEMRAHWALEITFAHSGDFARALEHFDRALALYEPDRHRDDVFLYGLDPGVTTRCFAAWSLWFLGRSDEALVRGREAVAMARELGEPHGLAHALNFVAVLHQHRREPEAAKEYADAAITISDEHGLALYRAMASIMGGWTRIARGNRDGTLDEMRRGLAAWEGTGAQLMRPYFMALVAEAVEPERDRDEGLQILDEALATTARTGEQWYEAELLRLKGERLARAGHGASAEADHAFVEALRVARSQSARAIELRAAVSFARVLRGRGEARRAAEVLGPVVASLTEGLDAVDVREATALLQEV